MESPQNELNKGGTVKNNSNGNSTLMHYHDITMKAWDLEL